MVGKSVKFSDLEDALFFLGMDYTGENVAYVNRETGEVILHSDFPDWVEEAGPPPDDIDDEDKYAPVPDKRELDLGKYLVLDFAREHLPDDFEKVSGIFSRSGAYARFKDLLGECDMLQQWYDYEARATREALRRWCEENDLVLED